MFTSDSYSVFSISVDILLLKFLNLKLKIPNSLYYPSCIPFEITLRKTEATLRPHIEFYV